MADGWEWVDGRLYSKKAYEALRQRLHAYLGGESTSGGENFCMGTKEEVIDN
jgi:hypothetical protein